MTTPYAAKTWKPLARRVLLRDGRRCQIRGDRCEGAATEVDHIWSWRLGKQFWFDPSNLRASCRPCNRARRSVLVLTGPVILPAGCTAAASEVASFAPDEIILLPLYPHYSITTTGSSFADWAKAPRALRLPVPSRIVRSYPPHPEFIAAQAELLNTERAKAGSALVRILFSAHGLPQKIIDAGDPYQREIEITANAIATAAGLAEGSWCVCYQSKVGPLKWLEPSLDSEIERAARDRVGVVVLPIAFVSEHSETLVELDMDYRERAAELGVAPYLRVPAPGTHTRFIACLADLVVNAVE